MVRDALIDRARDGVKIRVLYDDVGCWKVPHDFYEQMLCEGIEVLSFLKSVSLDLPVSELSQPSEDCGDRWLCGVHRWDESGRTLCEGIGKRKLERYTRQTGRKGGVRVADGFLTDWYAIDRTLLTSAEYFPPISVKGGVLGQIVTSDPVGEWRDIMQGLMMAICSTRRYFYVQTPYFLPNEEVMTALQTAALAGVDVRRYAS